ncbi:hypothetical protein N7468_010742 [Penicillium chermesinum]|uniref:Zinc-binding loop region of homing endonuclease domain-containing protein n=1 Tax=Penicillium chermesinum TaxID=63820 RepID=A0A9W9N9R4_9EURO|nr:uncharacterized protein N7468_010742 [Penicillium chermesinum]KAJ5215063.1 hypothetical protein N7468_010742 [Penicillium chermesinum]
MAIEHELTDYQPADTSGEQENDDTNDDLVVDEDPSGMDPQHNKASESAPDPAVTAPSPVPIRDRLLVMQATPQSWAKFCRMLHRPNLEAGPKARNQSLLPYVESLTDDDLLFPQDLPLGHCSVLCTATQRGSDIFVTPQLRESGSTQSAPRTTLLEGIPRKVLVSHIIAANEAHSAPTPQLNIPLLEAVSPWKQNSNAPMMVRHLCGHRWCMAPKHYAVGTKRTYEEQLSCHRGLHSAQSLKDYELVARTYCQHTPRCWAVLYKGRFRNNVCWS